MRQQRAEPLHPARLVCLEGKHRPCRSVTDHADLSVTVVPLKAVDSDLTKKPSPAQSVKTQKI